MLNLLPGGRILIAVESVDGRKGIDSLAGVVRSVLLGDPMSGDLFIFKTRRADKLKPLSIPENSGRRSFVTSTTRGSPSTTGPPNAPSARWQSAGPTGCT